MHTLIPGDEVGGWTIVELGEPTRTGQRRWRCRCECGTERLVQHASLHGGYGGSQSCGCRNGRSQATPDLPDEEWRPIPDFPGFAASQLGRIKRTSGVSPGQTTIGRVLVGVLFSPNRHHAGYRRVRLLDRKLELVHRLVMRAFVGPPVGARQHVNHKDGDPTNNRLDNLEYVTASENRQHAARVLGRGLGVENGNAVLTEDAVREIRAARGVRTCASLAADFGVSVATIKLIFSRKTWRHVTT